MIEDEDLPTQPYYRLHDVHACDGIKVLLEKWYPIKKTPSGMWVRSQYAPAWRIDLAYLKKRKLVKFILDNSCRKYCYPALEDAINSFKHRKRKQHQLLSLQLEQANICVENLDKLDGATVQSFDRDETDWMSAEGLLLGVPPSHYRFDFE